jgi:hypothetical protein
VTVLWVSFAAAVALLLIDTRAVSAVAGKLAGIVGVRIGVAAESVILATASRASAGPEHPLRRAIAR